MANQLAANGLNIDLIARKEKELRENAARIKQLYDVDTTYISADISTKEGIEMVKQVEREIGLLALAAGVEVNGAFDKTSLEKELQLIQLNVVSTFHLTHHFSKPMVDRKRGGLIMISSLVAHMVSPYFSNYSGSKAYVLQMGVSL